MNRKECALVVIVAIIAHLFAESSLAQCPCPSGICAYDGNANLCHGEDIALVASGTWNWSIDTDLDRDADGFVQLGLYSSVCDGSQPVCDRYLIGEPHGDMRGDNLHDEVCVYRSYFSPARVEWHCARPDGSRFSYTSASSGGEGKYIKCLLGLPGDIPGTIRLPPNRRDRAYVVRLVDDPVDKHSEIYVDANGNLAYEGEEVAPLGCHKPDSGDKRCRWPEERIQPNDVILTGNMDEFPGDELVVVRAGQTYWRWEVYLAYLPDDCPSTTKTFDFQFGFTTDLPLLGDVNGDGFADPMVYRTELPNRGLYMNLHHRGDENHGYTDFCSDARIRYTQAPAAAIALDIDGSVGPDDDLDVVPNCADNCPGSSNTSQSDFDRDDHGDACDADDDNDGVGDGQDPSDRNRFICGDGGDSDGCDDCASGGYDPSHDGSDQDEDGICDETDNCIGQANGPAAGTCLGGGSDNEFCNSDAECLGGSCSRNQEDYDGDGRGDACDADDDNDGVGDGQDPSDRNRFICGDGGDSDGCDDCASGGYDPSHDGSDQDEDGICDNGDNCAEKPNGPILGTCLNGANDHEPCTTQVQCPGGSCGRNQENCDGDSEGDVCDDEPTTDCNDNGMPDVCDIAQGVESDCNGNAIPDSCEYEESSLRFWINPEGGLFTDPHNWCAPVPIPPGESPVPGPSHTAVFFLPSRYVVTIPPGARGAGCRIEAGQVTLALMPAPFLPPQPATYRISGKLLVGSAEGRVARLELTGGGDLFAENGAEIAAVPGSEGYLIVSQATLRTGPVVQPAEPDILIGFKGVGTLEVREHGSVDVRSASVGGGAGAEGNVVVMGDGARWEVKGSLTIARGCVSVASPGVLVANFGIDVFPEGCLVGNGVVSGGLNNIGVVQADWNGTTTLEIVGDLMQSAATGFFNLGAGRLVFKLTGPLGVTPLKIRGKLTARGGLVVEMDEAHTPQVLEQIELIQSESRSEKFDVAFFPFLPGGRTFRVMYDSSDPKMARVLLTVLALSSSIDLADPLPQALADAPSAIDIGDLNNDGLPDLVLAIPDPINPTGEDGQIMILFNLGVANGEWLGFGSQASVTVGREPSGVVIAELDGQPGLDIAVANAEGSVTVLSNLLRADQPFVERHTILVDGEPRDIAALDLGRDQDTDLVVATVAKTSFAILENVAEEKPGEFREREEPLDTEPTEIETRDSDDYKDPDLIVLGHRATNRVTVVLVEANGDGSFSFVDRASIEVGSGPSHVRTEKLNEDGLPDVVTINPGEDSMSIIMMRRPLAEVSAVTQPLTGHPLASAIADLEGDGDQDIALLLQHYDGEPTVQSFRNDLDGGEQFSLVPADEREVGSEVGLAPLLVGDDVDRDGRSDLVVVGAGSAQAAATDASTLTTLLSNGRCDTRADRFVDCTTGPCTGASALGDCETADLNLDGCVDLRDFAVLQLQFCQPGQPLAVAMQFTPPRVELGGAYVPGNSLWRRSRNTIRISFSAPVAAPASGELVVQELLAEGAFGPNLNVDGNFSSTIEDGSVLRIRERADLPAILEDGKWYAIRNTGTWPGVAPFETQYLVRVGDQSGDGFRQNVDLAALNAHPNGVEEDQSRFDVDGDGFKTNADVTLASSLPLGNRPPKPSGH